MYRGGGRRGLLVVIPGLSQDDPDKEGKSLVIGAYEPLGIVGWIKAISIYSSTLHFYNSLPNSIIDKQSVEASKNADPGTFFVIIFIYLTLAP